MSSANLAFLPIGNKLKMISHDEVHARTMLIEGVISIQAGDNPRIVADKLMAFVPPEERQAAQPAESGSSRKAASKAKPEPDPVKVAA